MAAAERWDCRRRVLSAWMEIALRRSSGCTAPRCGDGSQ